VTGGAGTDSLTWSYAWDTDSLVWGENFLCFVPLEDQATTTGNLGLGTPFAGNPVVYAVYRVHSWVGLEEAARPAVRTTKLPTIIRGVLFLPRDMTETRSGISDRVLRSVLLDVNGRKVMDLEPGANDVRAMPPGVYFVREAQAQAQAQAVRKVVVVR